MEDKNIRKDAEDIIEKMDIEDLDKFSGGSISNAKKQKNKDLDDDVTNRV